MHADRFFQTTRGKIVERTAPPRSGFGGRSGAPFGLSPNAVRQQLVVLERDGLVAETLRSARPDQADATSSRLTAEADKLFPAGLRQDAGGGAARGARAIRPCRRRANFRRHRQAAVGKRARRRSPATSPEGRVAQLTELLREGGVVAEYSLIDGGFALHEHNCPYSNVAKEHPEVCSVIHHVIDETVGGTHEQTESLARGGKECRFELKCRRGRRV